MRVVLAVVSMLVPGVVMAQELVTPGGAADTKCAQAGIDRIASGLGG